MKDRKNQRRGLAKVSHLFLSGPEPPKEKVTIQVAARALGVSKGTIITYKGTDIPNERGWAHLRIYG